MHILSLETDNCPSWISGRERTTVENISWSISDLDGIWTRDLLVSSQTAHPTEPPRPAFVTVRALARLRLCAGSPEPLLVALVTNILFSCAGSFVPLWKHAYSNILKISPPKTESFQIKILIFFHISAQNIDCGYSLEPPHRGGSNEYQQSMFLSRNKKNNVYPCKPQFYYIKVGFKGVKII